MFMYECRVSEYDYLSQALPPVFLRPHATPCAIGFVSDPAQLKFTPLICEYCIKTYYDEKG